MLRVVSCLLFAVGSDGFGFSVVETTAATAAQVEVCHGSSSELELVTLDTGFPAEDSETRSDSLRATLAGGTLDVEAGQAMIVEVAWTARMEIGAACLTMNFLGSLSLGLDRGQRRRVMHRSDYGPSAIEASLATVLRSAVALGCRLRHKEPRG